MAKGIVPFVPGVKGKKGKTLDKLTFASIETNYAEDHPDD